MGWRRTEGGETGAPWKEDSKREVLEEREEVRVAAMDDFDDRNWNRNEMSFGNVGGFAEDP